MILTGETEEPQQHYPSTTLSTTNLAWTAQRTWIILKDPVRTAQ